MTSWSEERAGPLVCLEFSLARDPRLVALMRHVAAGILEDLRVPAEARDDVEVAVTEACDNAVRHATGASEFRVVLQVSAGGCEVEVSDLGPGLDPAALARERIGGLEEAGRGLGIMQALVDDVKLVGRAEGTCLRLHKRWASAGVGLSRTSARG